ncbi:MAG: class I SAM-dependent methyltransferase [Proteobacteria bacterium]|nr:class I SAM-dependent methyltransferase [Pseudomonadota bacterium]
MTTDPEIEYHLQELAAALDPASPAHALPEFCPTDRAILDIGCGIGQSLIVSGNDPGCLRVGIDVDRKSLDYGHRHYPQISHVVASAEALPFADGAFDLVMSRVALPYTDLRLSLPEIARVLAVKGRTWLSLHSFGMTWRHLKRSAGKGAWKDVLFRFYVIANGVGLHWFGTQLRFPSKHHCESFQTTARMRRSLDRLGLVDVVVKRDRHFICTARKRGSTRGVEGRSNQAPTEER